MATYIEDTYKYPKRKRLSTKLTCKPSSDFPRTLKRKYKIWHLPMEVLENIFSWISADYLAKEVRFVSTFFNEVVGRCLTKKFLKLDNRLLKAKLHIEKTLSSAKFYLTRRRLLKVSFCIEVLCIEYKLLEATIWRYVLKANNFKICMYGGKILDLFDDIIVKIYNKPMSLKAMNKRCIYLEKVKDLIKKFISHFERKIEFSINKNYLTSGAKICDILDCMIYIQKKILYEKYENGLCNLKIQYTINNAWFTAINTDSSSVNKWKSWPEEQLFMYLRIRRIAIAHNKLSLDQDHWERELPFLTTHRRLPSPPINQSFAGVGDITDNLFYYGSLNEGAYQLKFSHLLKNNVKKPHLVITIDLTCTLEQSPLFIYKKHCMNFDRKYLVPISKGKNHNEGESHFNLRMEFNCGLSEISRLPATFVFVINKNV